MSSPATRNVALVDERLTGGGEVAEQARHGDRAGAHADHVGIVAAGDLTGGLDRLLAGGDVGVEVPVALGGGGVAPADREIGHAGADQVLDEAAAGGEVGDVELVDLRRDRDERSRVRRLAGRRVLDELEHLAAVHDLARGDGEVAADRERAAVDRCRQAAVVAHVMGEVPHTAEEAAAPRLDRLGQRAGVAEHGIGRCSRFGEQRHREPGPRAALRIEFDLVDDFEEGSGLDEICLEEAPVAGVVAPCRVDEALVAGFRGHVAPSRQYLEQLARGVQRRGRDDGRLDGHSLEQSTQSRGHLPGAQPDEGVGAQHHRIRRIERFGDGNGRGGRLGGLGGHCGSPVVTR